MINLHYNRWVKSQRSQGKEAKCPTCRSALEEEFIDEALGRVSNAIQCTTAFEAWKEMGGSEDDFPHPPTKCCGKLGIKCDDDGNIVELNWS